MAVCSVIAAIWVGLVKHKASLSWSGRPNARLEKQLIAASVGQQLTRQPQWLIGNSRYTRPRTNYAGQVIPVVSWNLLRAKQLNSANNTTYSGHENHLA